MIKIRTKIWIGHVEFHVIRAGPGCRPECERLCSPVAVKTLSISLTGADTDPATSSLIKLLNGKLCRYTSLITSSPVALKKPRRGHNEPGTSSYKLREDLREVRRSSHYTGAEAGAGTPARQNWTQGAGWIDTEIDYAASMTCNDQAKLTN